MPIPQEILHRIQNNDSSLTSLDLRKSQIGGEEARALATGLQGNTAVTSINLLHNQIGPEGAQALATVLERNTTLKYLNLAGNQIGDIGAQAIADVSRGTALETLCLTGNQIGDVGAQALAAALERNTTLKTLVLAVGTIGDVGAQALATALRENRTLTILGLEGNRIGDAGAQALAGGLWFNTTLTSLNLSVGNDIEVGKAIQRLLERNKGHLGEVGLSDLFMYKAVTKDIINNKESRLSRLDDETLKRITSYLTVRDIPQTQGGRGPIGATTNDVEGEEESKATEELQPTALTTRTQAQQPELLRETVSTPIPNQNSTTTAEIEGEPQITEGLNTAPPTNTSTRNTNQLQQSGRCLPKGSCTIS
ncbi:MAG: hypothetical protein KGP29_03280 [Proteobacteria bacterium]|nr:hypothetical protein [Pseudomonadota bacterium]